MILLHLGSGGQRLGHPEATQEVTVDLMADCDVRADARTLPFGDGVFDSVYAAHLIEHLNEAEGVEALQEWRRVLKRGGEVLVRCPDFDAILDYLVRGGPLSVAYESAVGPIRPMDMLYGYQPDLKRWPSMGHRWAYTQRMLGAALQAAGFRETEVAKEKAILELWGRGRA